MTDPTQILKSIAQGNRQAFEELYQLFKVKVYNTALSYVQNVEDAEEVTQDVFTTIYRKANQFQGNSSVNTWIYRITVNSSLNFIKKRNRSVFSVFNSNTMDPPNFEHPGVQMENKESSAFLFKAIDSLPESQKTAFILSFVEELPRQEVADIMEISLKATESLLQRAKVNLREKLEKMYPHRRKSK